MIYPKGAYILHMLRMMMYDHRGSGDRKFREMMSDFVKTHFNKDVSNEDFKRAVEKHITPEMDVDKNGRMDWFFNQWVYGTDIPDYRFEYQLGSADGKPTFSGSLKQSNVSKDFFMVVPIYADFGKGWTRLGSATITGNSTLDFTSVPLPQQPKRLAICALNDVLATSIENAKR